MMKRILRLHRAINLGGAFGLIPKGDYVLEKKQAIGYVDPAVLNHWLVKGFLKDGFAIIISKDEVETGAGDKGEGKANQTPSTGKPKGGNRRNQARHAQPKVETDTNKGDGGNDPGTNEDPGEGDPADGDPANDGNGNDENAERRSRNS